MDVQQTKSAIEVTKIYDELDSDVEEGGNEGKECLEQQEDVSKLVNLFSHMSITEPQNEQNDDTESNSSPEPCAKRDDLSTATTDEESSTSDSSDTIDMSSDDEDNLPNLPTDRGDGDADGCCGSDSNGHIIKVTMVPKTRECDPGAYNRWLKAKNEEKREVRQQEMQLKLQKQQEEEERKEMNKQKIKQWMERKKQECVKPQKQQTELNEKKKMSRAVYQDWLRTAKDKPKPVPLNQGPNTLRGTISKIFVNPEPWKNNCE
uniref:Coiled-coil domain-containing protein n=1 Tax=Anopheles farauti TaxID=69004 RepID=A0A182Q519_9DIPT